MTRFGIRSAPSMYEHKHHLAHNIDKEPARRTVDRSGTRLSNYPEDGAGGPLVCGGRLRVKVMSLSLTRSTCAAAAAAAASERAPHQWYSQPPTVRHVRRYLHRSVVVSSGHAPLSEQLVKPLRPHQFPAIHLLTTELSLMRWNFNLKTTTKTTRPVGASIDKIHVFLQNLLTSAALTISTRPCRHHG